MYIPSSVLMLGYIVTVLLVKNLEADGKRTRFLSTVEIFWNIGGKLELIVLTSGDGHQLR